MAEKRYYVRVRGKVLGPFGVPQLRSLRDRGQFRAFHEVSEDRKSWASAASLDNLFLAEDRPTAATGGGEASEGTDAPAGPAEQWRYVTADGQEAGPVNRAALLKLRHDGSIQDATLVWREGMADWVSFADAGFAAQRQQTGARITAVDALPLFLSDPVGSLPKLCTSLRPGTAFSLGVGFYLLAVLGTVVGWVLYAEMAGFPAVREAVTIHRAGNRGEVLLYLLRLLALIAIPLVSLSGAVSVVRLTTRGRGNFGADTLIAGATWLPLGLSLPILALLGGNFELVFFLLLVLNVLQILLLNSAVTRGMQLPDRGAIFAIPAMLVLSLYLCKVIFVALFGPVLF